jgi:hypothetical protein
VELLAGLLLAILVTPSISTQSQAKPAIDKRAAEVFLRTRRVSTTYAVYQWNEVADNLHTGRSEWAAEFHSGKMHRVETPSVRVVADCSTLAGFMYDVAKKQVIADPSAGAYACGINLGAIPRVLEFVRQVRSVYGPLDVIHVIDDRDDRFYGVSAAGVIITTDYTSLKDDGHCLQGTTIALSDKLPQGDLFSEASLNETAVPEKYRTEPQLDIAPGNNGKVCRDPSRH